MWSQIGNCVAGFFRWIGGREYAALRAENSLLKEQHRAEISAIEQNLRVVESERDGLKFEVESERKEHSLTKDKLKQAENTIQQLNDANNRQARMIEDIRRLPDNPIFPNDNIL